MPLTDAEKNELEYLENPQVQFLTPPTSGVFGHFIVGDAQNKRKNRVVALRTKLRMEELGLNEQNDWQKYYDIKSEEEDRFDKKFANDN
ncbi:MAG: hypothetical protein WC457_03395 [Patescibacteria group bacterium]